jgi:hypothetical protein
VKIQGKPYGAGEGGNKREAERRAAEVTLAQLDREAAGATKAAPGGGRRGPPGRRAGQDPDARRRRRAGAGRRGRGRRGDAPEPFGGPWPVFERVLAESLRIAHARVDADLRGDVALAGIEAFASRLYKDVLEGLGEVVEDD